MKKVFIIILLSFSVITAFGINQPTEKECVLAVGIQGSDSNYGHLPGYHSFAYQPGQVVYYGGRYMKCVEPGKWIIEKEAKEQLNWQQRRSQ